MADAITLNRMRENSLEKTIEQEEQFLTLRISGQLFGIPVLKVRDVLKPQKVTYVPKARQEILGLMNLRGRIVTVINMPVLLNVEASKNDKKKMFIVVDHENEYYSLSVDEVGQTLTLKTSDFEKNPANLSENWRGYSKGVFKLENELLLVFDILKIVRH